MLRSYPEPHLAAVGALACATRANPGQIAGLTLVAVTPVDASLASGHRIAPPFQPLLDAQRLARDADGADGDEPLFLAPDGTQPAAARHIQTVARADQSRDRPAVRERLWMEPIHDTRVGDLSTGRDPRTDRALNPRSRTAPGLPGCRPADNLDRFRTTDERAVEALLASVHEPCTAHQLGLPLRNVAPTDK